MFSGVRGDQLVARLWRLFVARAFLAGILVWIARDAARASTMEMSTCIYGRCSTALGSGHTSLHPTAANIALLGAIVTAVAWVVPIVLHAMHQAR